MGGRLLKKWISRPLKKKEQIDKRLEAVNELFKSKRERKKMIEDLKSIPLERLVSKIATGKAVRGIYCN